jgi:hypothetical protein
MGKKRKRRISPEESAYAEARYEHTTRLLQERIAYHEAKMAEEKRAGEERAEG